MTDDNPEYDLTVRLTHGQLTTLVGVLTVQAHDADNRTAESLKTLRGHLIDEQQRNERQPIAEDDLSHPMSGPLPGSFKLRLRDDGGELTEPEGLDGLEDSTEEPESIRVSTPPNATGSYLPAEAEPVERESETSETDANGGSGPSDPEENPKRLFEFYHLENADELEVADGEFKPPAAWTQTYAVGWVLCKLAFEDGWTDCYTMHDVASACPYDNQVVGNSLSCLFRLHRAVRRRPTTDIPAASDTPRAWAYEYAVTQGFIEYAREHGSPEPDE